MLNGEAIMAETKYLDAAIDGVYERLESVGGNPFDLPSVVQPIAMLYTVQAIIDNGGFQYLFENDLLDQPYSAFVSAYRSIGAQRAAEALEKAISFFPFPDPHVDRERRMKFLETLDEDHEITQLGDEVCGDETIWILMDQYVSARPEAFPSIESA